MKKNVLQIYHLLKIGTELYNIIPLRTKQFLGCENKINTISINTSHSVAST